MNRNVIDYNVLAFFIQSISVIYSVNPSSMYIDFSYGIFIPFECEIAHVYSLIIRCVCVPAVMLQFSIQLLFGESYSSKLSDCWSVFGFTGP